MRATPAARFFLAPRARNPRFYRLPENVTHDGVQADGRGGGWPPEADSGRSGSVRFNSAMLFLAAAGMAAGAASADGFRTPSDNIHCLAGVWDGVAELRCDLRANSAAIPKRPANCDLEWGSAFVVTGAAGRAIRACVGDTVLDPGYPVIQYGSEWATARLHLRGGNHRRRLPQSPRKRVLAVEEATGAGIMDGAAARPSRRPARTSHGPRSRSANLELVRGWRAFASQCRLLELSGSCPQRACGRNA